MVEIEKDLTCFMWYKSNDDIVEKIYRTVVRSSMLYEQNILLDVS